METSETRHTTGPQAVSPQEFTACVDHCVCASLEGSHDGFGAATAQARLERWLDAGAMLTDGRIVDTALFDAAILDIEERLPSRGRDERARLLGAARRLAERVYAHAAARLALPAT